MRVLVDTPIWSFALRRKSDSLSAKERGHLASLADLVRDGRVVMIGIVRQEVLSGVTDVRKFAELRDTLSAFPDEPVKTLDHVRAAEMSNLCRAAGVQGSPVDFLICAVAERTEAPILTADADFERYARHVPIKLFRPRLQG